MRVGIIGATGYGGIELIRFLMTHPKIENVMLYSSTQDGIYIEELYPHLANEKGLLLKKLDLKTVASEVETMFLATPPGVSSEWSERLLEAGLSIIDLSGDVRLKDPSIYETWYKRPAANSTLLEQSVYGLSEWNEKKIVNARLVANPGCFPTAVLLGLAPLVKADIVDMDSIIIDAKTGTSGAGKSPSITTHFSEMNENLKIYGVASHKHTPEIEQELGNWQGKTVSLTFQPHLVPMVRGIMATMYVQPSKHVTKAIISKLFDDAYEKAPFVRLSSEGSFPATKHVFASNYCDIGFTYDERTKRIIVVSVIDNLVKGAVGQAIQNLNIMHGFEQKTGLGFLPVFP